MLECVYLLYACAAYFTRYDPRRFPLTLSASSCSCDAALLPALRLQARSKWKGSYHIRQGMRDAAPCGGRSRPSTAGENQRNLERINVESVHSVKSVKVCFKVHTVITRRPRAAHTTRSSYEGRRGPGRAPARASSTARASASPSSTASSVAPRCSSGARGRSVRAS